MKRTVLFIASLLLTISISSCKKDGVYNPKEKIDKIYLKYGSNKHLSEDWTWKDKQLKSIEYYNSDGTLESTCLFSYNDKQLIQVDNHEEKASMRYNYDNKDRVLKASFSEDGILSMIYEFEYDGNKISDIKVTLYDDEVYLKVKNAMNPLTYILPQQLSESIYEALKDSPSRKNTVIAIELEWDGKNITEVEYSSDKYTEKSVFEYDNKSNPFRDFLGLYFEESIFEHGNFASKNNITKIYFEGSYNGSSYTDTEIITYTYDGKFPVTRSYDNMTEYFEYE